MIEITRRRFIQSAGFMLMVAGMPLRLARAEGAGEKRLLVVILRGAMDGLAAVVPYADKGYSDARGSMAMPLSTKTLIRLDQYFAMPTTMAPMAAMFKQKELLVMHATSTPYRERSHFDAQNLLENGSDKPHALQTGWLNRTVVALSDGHEPVAVGPNVPLVLRGSAKVTSWAPSILPSSDPDFLKRVAQMYENDPLLLNAISSAPELENMESTTAGRGPKAFNRLMEKAAGFLGAPNGARIATVELSGWDSHANQGTDTGRLASNLAILADGLEAFKQASGPVWQDTAVLVVTEFGRTVKGNGTAGTDHGTASCAFLLGGNVAGGRVVGDWPGLSRLYEDRDLMPANDLRILLKGTLLQHLGVDEATLSTDIFPASAHIRPMQSLFNI